MATSQRPKGHNSALSTLYVLTQTLNIAKDACGIPPAQAVFGSAVALLIIIRVRFPLLCEGKPSHLHSSRTQWQMIKITSISGWLAAKYVKLSTGG